ncbi:unnamed protein product [Miscanthus lutarioriparius]|uniref:Uncharacterized protein n=1 Tax=Miscanthus lutarioriparius TaxID=422564 RepID=A0A811QHH7_9POAL|nr:unnamed protein product [Miscanthus lutarioriparius]
MARARNRARPAPVQLDDATQSTLVSAVMQNLEYGSNIIQNCNLDDGLNRWFPLGPCMLSVHDGGPRVLPPMAQESLALDDEPLNGKHIHVRVGAQQASGAGAPQTINIAFVVDSQWINGGQVLARDERWYEVGGAFRVEAKPASCVMMYVQGPDAGVDLMVAGLQVFLVDRKARV